jgi:hypothetical protein
MRRNDSEWLAIGNGEYFQDGLPRCSRCHGAHVSMNQVKHQGENHASPDDCFQ